MVSFVDVSVPCSRYNRRFRRSPYPPPSGRPPQPLDGDRRDAAWDAADVHRRLSRSSTARIMIERSAPKWGRDADHQ